MSIPECYVRNVLGSPVHITVDKTAKYLIELESQEAKLLLRYGVYKDEISRGIT